jgi:RNA polymerase sigma factor (TIGR02999 family)
MSNVTSILSKIELGDQHAAEQLLPLVYDELRKLAAGHMANEAPGHTLDATGLVHEAYLKLVEQSRVSWQNREHFFAISANLMRQILVNYANARLRKKRGGSAEILGLDETILVVAKTTEVDLLGLDEALTRLGEMDKQQEQIVEMRYFSGLTIEETAEVLGVSPATIKRDWRMTKAWLYRELSGRDGSGGLAKS